jgi:hypothetical protein
MGLSLTREIHGTNLGTVGFRWLGAKASQSSEIEKAPSAGPFHWGGVFMRTLLCVSISSPINAEAPGFPGLRIRLSLPVTWGRVVDYSRVNTAPAGL